MNALFYNTGRVTQLLEELVLTNDAAPQLAEILCRLACSVDRRTAPIPEPLQEFLEGVQLLLTLTEANHA